ncbi:MAG: YibE/F family protein [Candidatus Roizmanbacteria bacterium]
MVSTKHFFRLILSLFIFVVIVSFPSTVIGQTPTIVPTLQKPQTYEATIIDIVQKSKKTNGVLNDSQDIKLKLEEGSEKGKNVTTSVMVNPGGKQQEYVKGERVVVQISQMPDGSELIYIVDYVRTTPLFLLLFLFILIVFIIGRWRGLMSIIGMIFSFLIIIQFIIPSIIAGNNPILISLLASTIVLPVTFYISHGFNAKTTISIVGTCIALFLTGILAIIFVYAVKLSGFDSDEAMFLQTIMGEKIDVRNLLLAGIIIGASGVLDDITISQTAIVEKLIDVQKRPSFWQLYNQAMDVGRDHIASLVNTIFLVYVGASLPLFLLFSHANESYMKVINQEIVATEIVRTLVSSIGIISAVPITTLLACIYLKKRST